MTDITELAQSLKRRAASANEFGESLYVKADDVIALVEALEKAQRMESYWKTQCRGITDHCEELQARIAELESRTVTVKMPEPFKLAKSSSGLTYYFADDVDAALTAAGIKWEAE
ncbi:hypothetical protein [Klebsiella michiganensis]|uniref:hypothetical protein n=1 Tax=Klebsiella michiganensis TaxID=1134687 RepID=UPI001F4B57BB|nr:hypothetical protein [Klebsiella michiganensis]HCJ7646610.1 hypothetical protein [Klebsiella michiganensis]